MASVHKNLTARLSGPLRGAVAPPCGPLEAHLALALAAVTVGRSVIAGIDQSPDIQAMIAAIRSFGCRVEVNADGDCFVDGVGVGGLAEPDCIIELGQAGFGSPYLIALAASQPMTTMFNDGKETSHVSWHGLTAALENYGASFLGGQPGKRPVTVLGATNPTPTEFVAHSRLERFALLLAALNCPGETVVSHEFAEQECIDSILEAFGVKLSAGPGGGTRFRSRVQGQRETWPAKLSLPFDPATAILLATTAFSRSDSDILLEGLEIEFRMPGTFHNLRALGAEWSVTNLTMKGQAPVHDWRLRSGPLTGVVFPPEKNQTLIEDYPQLAVLAARAVGTTVFEDWGPRADWLEPLVRGLQGCGVDAHAEATSLVVVGNGGVLVPGGHTIEAGLDHRVAAAFLLLGLTSEAPVALEEGAALLDHYPSFFRLLERLGGSLTVDY